MAKEIKTDSLLTVGGTGGGGREPLRYLGLLLSEAEVFKIARDVYSSWTVVKTSTAPLLEFLV